MNKYVKVLIIRCWDLWKENTLQATIKTNYGEIVINLLPEETPKTVDNFVSLSKSGFYDEFTDKRIKWVGR